MRGDKIKMNSINPFYLISKNSKEITHINWKRYSEIKKERAE